MLQRRVGKAAETFCTDRTALQYEWVEKVLAYMGADRGKPEHQQVSSKEQCRVVNMPAEALGTLYRSSRRA